MFLILCLVNCWFLFHSFFQGFTFSFQLRVVLCLFTVLSVLLLHHLDLLLWLVFSLIYSVFCKTWVFNFDVQFVNFLFHKYAFGVISKKSLSNTRSSKFSLRSFIVLGYEFRCIINFEFLYICEIWSKVSFFAHEQPVVVILFVEKDSPFFIELPLHL